MSGPQEGTPNGVDRLAHIESCAEDAEGGRWCSVETADVLALVEIAKAAERIADLDGGYHEGSPHWEALFSALARLDSGAAEENT